MSTEDGHRRGLGRLRRGGFVSKFFVREAKRFGRRHCLVGHRFGDGRHILAAAPPTAQSAWGQRQQKHTDRRDCRDQALVLGSRQLGWLHLHLHHTAARPEPGAHFGHAGFGLGERGARVVLGLSIPADVLADLHAAELGAAHGAEVGGLVRFLGQGGVVVLAGGFRVEAEVELVFPAELEPRLAQRVVADLRARVPLGQVRRVRGDLVGDDAGLDVVLVRQPQVLLGRHVAEHRATEPADHRRTDARGDVVVPRRDVGGQRAQGVERRLVAALELLVHVLLDQLHRHVAGAFDHALHVMLPGDLGQLAQGLQLAELRRVVGVGDRARTQAVAQRKADVVGLHDFADFVEMGVEEVLLVMRQAPLGHDRAAAADDAGHALGGERHVAQQHAGVDGEVVHALLGLLDQGVAEDLPGQCFGAAVDFLQRLVDRHGTDRHRRVADDPLAGLVDVLAGGQVHHRVAAPADRPHQLLHLFGNAGGHRAVADVGVDLGQEVTADDHRLTFRMVDVVGQHRTAARDFIAHELRRDDLLDRSAERLARMLLQQAGIADRFQPLVLADRDEFHFRGDDAAARVMHLGDVGTCARTARQAARGEAHRIELRVMLAIATERRTQSFQPLGITAFFHPAATQCRQTSGQIDAHLRVGVRARRVVNGHRCILFSAEQGRRAGQRDLAHRHLQIRA
uniref:NAD-specific glutamate dehydrogenase n=1 Tax=Parastrongyloides trichosuri TaxID=131310 RepID=A0A0N4ZJL5_PARTI